MMTDNPDPTLERIARRIPVPQPASERMLRRRDRKRQNQRLAAGSVGIAFFLVVVFALTTIGLLDHTQTPADPGAATGPAETGPIDTSPTAAPATGEVDLIAHYAQIHVGFVYVYADGRVIWYAAENSRRAGSEVNEQRLSAEGVDIVRSGGPFHPVWNGPRRFLLQSDGTVLPDEVFGVAGAWADPEVRPYVPATWAICAGPDALTLLPEAAADLLRGKERTFDHEAGLGGAISPTTCFEVTTEEARALGQIFTEMLGWSFYGGEIPHWSRLVPGADPFGFEPADRAELGIDPGFRPLLPHGQWVEWGG